MSGLLKTLIVLTLCAPALHAQWEKSALPFHATAISSNGGSLLICGPEAGIAWSSDGGITWHISNQQAKAPKLLSIGFASPDLGYAGGEGGLLLLTVDGGAKWQQLPATFSESVLDLSFSDAQHGIVLTTSAVLYTSDGGKSWQPLPLSQFPELKDFKFVLEVAALGNTAAVLLKSGPAQFYDQRLISTQDAGHTWKIDPFEHMTINNLLVVHDQYWVVGTEVIDRENRGGHAVSVTLHSSDGLTWDRGPRPLIDTNNACRPEGCLMWNGVYFDPFVPHGTIYAFPSWSDPSAKNGRTTISLHPSFRATQWAAANSRICAFMPDLQCAAAAIVPTLPQHGGPAPALGAFELRLDKATR